MHLLGTRVITEQTTGLQWDIDTEEGQIGLGDDSIILSLDVTVAAPRLDSALI